jgi:hypothetical protein
MSDDRIVYAGGVDSKGQPLASAEVFDPKTGSWAPFPSLPEPRFDTTAVALADGRIFLIGGSPTSPGAATDSVLVFDPRRDVWIE